MGVLLIKMFLFNDFKSTSINNQNSKTIWKPQEKITEINHERNIEF